MANGEAGFSSALPTTELFLSMLADGKSLAIVLDSIVRSLQLAQPGVSFSILLLDPIEKCLRHGAAPSLPRIYNDAIDGLKIGPGIGCCGQAAFTRKRVVVNDVMTHPNWVPFQDLARLAGFRSSASQPVLSSDGKQVLATLAIYHAQPNSWCEEYAHWLETGALLIRSTIEQSQRMSQ